MAEAVKNHYDNVFAKLPYISDSTPILSNLEALRARALLTTGMNSGVGKLIRSQVELVTTEVSSELQHNNDGTITLSPPELRGIIARAAIHGGMQSLFGVAESMRQAEEFAWIFSGEEPDADTASVEIPDSDRPTLF